MNDDMRTRLIKLKNEKVAHRNDLALLKSKGIAADWDDDDDLDIDRMIAREDEAIDNLERAIARLT
ncbi:hypothetical protein [Rhizobium sp. RAF56]|jgi:hypothetical protein|uniref:hypothetical protein n=1 Tax=Rhizobium sp. RAF56 TaxID=3233062 RepID=UPI003F95882E